MLLAVVWIYASLGRALARYFRPAALRNRWTTVSTRKEGAVDSVSVGLLLITFQSLSPDGAAAAALNGALP